MELSIGKITASVNKLMGVGLQNNKHIHQLQKNGASTMAFLEYFLNSRIPIEIEYETSYGEPSDNTQAQRQGVAYRCMDAQDWTCHRHDLTCCI